MDGHFVGAETYVPISMCVYTMILYIYIHRSMDDIFSDIKKTKYMRNEIAKHALANIPRGDNVWRIQDG